MGGQSSSMKTKSRSVPDLDRIRPTAEQRTPQPRSKNKLASIAQSTKNLSKLSFKRKGNGDKAKFFRELISSWPIQDVQLLFEELDASRKLSLLRVDADLARPSSMKMGEQLMAADTKNFRFVHNDKHYPVHRCLVYARCTNLRNTISSTTEFVVLPAMLEVSEDDISAIVLYLYTDCLDESREGCVQQGLEWLGCTDTLEAGLTWMERRGLVSGDLELVLSRRITENDDKDTAQSSASTTSEYRIRMDSELVAGRSPLLRSLIRRNPGGKQLVLDETLLPRGFAPLLVHYLYTDRLDFNKMSSCGQWQSSLSDALAIVAGRSPHSDLHRASHLVHVARFFQLDRLAQLCEDVIVSSFCVESCVSILSWALDGGSKYVARRAESYLQSEFSKIATTHNLFDIGIDSMQRCLESQFLQASEVEILEATIRWGEHELLRRMEGREPNIVADTCHSISRRGVRRADINTEELGDILGSLTKHIRTDYVLPPFHQSLNEAYRRGILERAPLKDLVCPSTSEINPDIHWFRPEPAAPGPRFYLPHYRIAKQHLRSMFDKTCDYEGPSVLSPATNGTLKLCIVNRLPELVDDDMFEKIRFSIESSFEMAEKKFAVSSFPRLYHLRMAISLVTSRVLREFGVEEEAIEVRLDGDIDDLDEGEAKDSTSDDMEQESGPALCLPDIMTFERRKTRKEPDEHSGEYDPTPDEDQPPV